MSVQMTAIIPTPTHTNTRAQIACHRGGGPSEPVQTYEVFLSDNTSQVQRLCSIYPLAGQQLLSFNNAPLGIGQA